MRSKKHGLAKIAFLRSQINTAASSIGGGLAGGVAGASAADEGSKLKAGLAGALGGAAVGYKGRKMYSASKHRNMFRKGSEKSRTIYEKAMDDAKNIGRSDKTTERKNFFEVMRDNRKSHRGKDRTKRINSDILKELKGKRKEGKYFEPNIKYERGEKGFQSEARGRTDKKYHHSDDSAKTKRPRVRISESKKEGLEGADFEDAYSAKKRASRKERRRMDSEDWWKFGR